MKVNFLFQESKTGEADGGDDRVAILDDYVAVIDGATSKSGERINGKTGGALVAEIIATSLQELPKIASAFDACAFLTRAVHEQLIAPYFSHTNTPNYQGDRPNASVIIYSSHLRQIWRIGDGHFKIDNFPTNFGTKEIDIVNSRRRADFNRAMIDKGLATKSSLMERDLGREFILPMLMSQSLHMNNPNSDLGYGVIDGRTVPEKFVEIYPVGNAKNLMLSSDGLLEPQQQQPTSSLDISQSIEDQLCYYLRDPLLIGEHKSTKGLTKETKWHDDITIISLSL